MAQQLIDIGVAEDTQTGDPGRTVCIKVNENTTELYAIKAQVQYTQITTQSTLINDSDLILGQNIFGVNFAEEDETVSIALPANIDSNKLVIINDESGTASVNNVQISVLELLAPIDFNIDSVTSTTATVSWTDPERGSAIGRWIYVNGVPEVNVPWATGSPVVVPNLTTSTFYTMSMVTYVADFLSDSSNEDTATTL